MEIKYEDGQVKTVKRNSVKGRAIEPLEALNYKFYNLGDLSAVSKVDLGGLERIDQVEFIADNKFERAFTFAGAIFHIEKGVRTKRTMVIFLKYFKRPEQCRTREFLLVGRAKIKSHSRDFLR